LHSELNKKDIYYVENIINKFNSKIIYYKIDENSFKDLKLSKSLPKESYYRLLIPELIKSSYILYLDIDTIILGNITSLLNIDLHNYPVAAVKDFGNINHLNKILPNNSSFYFNTGVMLLNLDKWRAENISNKVIDFIKCNTDLIRFADQCGINAVINSNLLTLDPIFNFQLGIFKLKNNININTQIILHYTSRKDFFNFYKFPKISKNIFFNYYKKIDIFGFYKFLFLVFVYQYLFLHIYNIARFLKKNYFFNKKI
jgi:lipopolysaccharide biosynthesis glycosyltransferase